MTPIEKRTSVRPGCTRGGGCACRGGRRSARTRTGGRRPGRGGLRRCGCRACGRARARARPAPRRARAARRGTCARRARTRCADARSRGRRRTRRGPRTGAGRGWPRRSIIEIVAPAGMSTPPIVVDTCVRRWSVFTGLSNRSVSSMKFGSELAVAAQPLLQLGVLGQHPQRRREQARRRLAAGREQVRGDAHDVDGLGQRAVGEGRRGEPGDHVVARLRAAVLDVPGELARRGTRAASIIPPSALSTTPGTCVSSR